MHDMEGGGVCSCNRDERRCVAGPKSEGTICGIDGDFNFDQCNQGPGFCKTIENSIGTFGLCIGLPKIGTPCNDFNQCTLDDSCKVVVTDDGFFRGQCIGKFDAGAACFDYDTVCTINSR